ncbi:MAG: NAD-binding protein [Methanobrevibacter sp.]|nr:NAD-binding protein [Methanobrevibacter sp.]
MKTLEMLLEYFKRNRLVNFGILIILAIILYGVLGSIFIMHLNIYDSIYYTIITIATVGYGDITPITPLEKIFTVTLILAGVGLLAYILTFIISSVTENLQNRRSGRIMAKRLAEMENHYVLCGFGRVGLSVFEELKKRNQKVIIVDMDEKATEDIEEDENIVVYNANATEDKTIKKLNIDKSLGVIIATGNDVDNLFMVLSIRELYKDAWIITRASKKENYKRLKHAGADKIISPEASGGVDLYFAAVEPNLVYVTQRHGIDFLEREFEILKKHDCHLENIEYHFPGVRTPVTRTIGVLDEEERNHFIDRVKNNPDVRESLDIMYNTVNGVHSHWISGPDKDHIDMAIEELEKEGSLLGINLEFKEINEFTRQFKE